MVDITKDLIAAYQRDGAVLINGLWADWVGTLRAGIDRNLAEPSEFAAENLKPGEGGRFFDDYCNWLFPILFEIEKFADPTRNSLNTSRKLGYIAEQLTPLYFHHNKLKIKHLPVAFVNPLENNKSWIRYCCSNFKSTLKFWFRIK